MALSETPAVIASESALVTDNNNSYVDWPAILAGTLLATAISFVLLTFGSAIGLSLTSAYEGRGMSLFWFAIAASLWLLWVQLSGFMAGGYLAGRMRRRHGDATEYESDIRDGSHGLVVWALGVLLGALIAVSGVSGAVSTATQAVATAGGAAAEAVADEVDPNALLVDRFLRGGPNASEPAPTATRDEVGRILSALGDGELNAADRQYLTATVQARAGIDEAQATQRVDQMVAEAQRLEAEAREAADTARRIAMVAAFMTAASLLVSAAGAYFAATLGGNHRDKQSEVAGWYKPW
jgi:hypothetical protein